MQLYVPHYSTSLQGAGHRSVEGNSGVFSEAVEDSSKAERNLAARLMLPWPHFHYFAFGLPDLLTSAGGDWCEVKQGS